MMIVSVTKQGVRDLNSLGPQRKRPPRDDQPRNNRGAEKPAAPTPPVVAK
jgi:hypothetical protein